MNKKINKKISLDSHITIEKIIKGWHVKFSITYYCFKHYDWHYTTRGSILFNLIPFKIKIIYLSFSSTLLHLTLLLRDACDVINTSLFMQHDFTRLRYCFLLYPLFSRIGILFLPKDYRVFYSLCLFPFSHSSRESDFNWSS